jgi:DNA-binding LacI/PurR family transcriptional regulator
VLAGDTDTEAGLREGFELSPGRQGQVRVFRHDGTREGVEARLDQALSPPEPATAVLVARTTHVLTVLTSLLRRGKRMPQDVAVIARDDDPFLAHVNPQVARYKVFPESFARRLSRMAIQLGKTGLAPARPIRLMPTFVPGETV